jgi:chaperone required for assembly of F1-ATPase
MKRFWSEVSVVCDDGLFVVRLDGRPMRLPGGPMLRLRQRGLAEAIAAEWRAAAETMSAADVPLTGLAGTAQTIKAGGAVEAIAAYGASDLLCYRAAQPAALVRRQAREWGPWVGWAAARLGAELRVGEGVMPVAQDGAALVVLRAAVAGFDAFGLAGLGVIVPALGSLVLGLAVAEGALEIGAAYRLSILDELFEEEAWGVDGERMARRAAVERDLADAARFMALAASR